MLACRKMYPLERVEDAVNGREVVGLEEVLQVEGTIDGSDWKH